MKRKSDWLDNAICHGRHDEFDTPPHIWRDARSNRKPADLAMHLVTWGAVCEGCPVMMECAKDVTAADVAVIRAGIPLPDRNRKRAAAAHGLDDILDLIGRGVSPGIAVAGVMGGTDD
ncbi:hypothetical protein [Corynebacterium auriscanis]|uniref:hypothetical protein n=1 Tax=Corynebacterium auriscanis TaxID=99807 RepID=UPI0024AC97B2|nr:hypothetical protein [Corynebacterium auriscanis]